MFASFFKKEISPQDRAALSIIKNFAEKHYPHLPLTDGMISQLIWLQLNSVITSQSNIQLRNEEVNVEVRRAFSRLDCLRLLKEDNPSAHAHFVSGQPAAGRLSHKNFMALSDLIKVLSPAAHQCLEASTVLAKSDQATAAVPVDSRKGLPADSEQYLTHLVSNFSNILPICSTLTDEARALLPYAFYSNAHARHLLDMEGGHNMLTSLVEGIKNNMLTQEQYALWFARWIINVAGLDGHVDPIGMGSTYLINPVADCLLELKRELDALWENPEHPVLENYLRFRVEQLQVGHPCLAHLGALMRQYTPVAGVEIRAWFDSLSAEAQQQRITIFEKQLAETRVTPTFKPPLLANLKAICSVSEALTIFTQIEACAMKLYADAVAAGRILPTTPLSFRTIGFKEQLTRIVAYYQEHHTLLEFEINEDGYLNVASSASQAAQLTTV